MANKRLPSNMLAPSSDPLASTAPGPRGGRQSNGRRKAEETAAPAEAPARAGRKPGPGGGKTAPVRVSAYLRVDQYTSLQAEIERRMRALGWPSRIVPTAERPDLAGLIREAVDVLLKGAPRAHKGR